MNKVLSMLLIMSCILGSQLLAADAAKDVAKKVVSENMISQVLSKATVAVHFCANEIKQGAAYIGNKAGNLVIAAWDKLTKTTTGKIAGGTVGAAVIIAAVYELSQKLHYRAPQAAH